MVLDKGVVIGETHTHDLKYYEDTTGDGVADKIEMFHEGGSRGGNMEHQPNGFVWALDNWWYSTYNGFRYRLSTETNKLVQQSMPGQTQWGIAQDLYGKVWYNDAGGEKGPSELSASPALRHERERQDRLGILVWFGRSTTTRTHKAGIGVSARTTLSITSLRPVANPYLVVTGFLPTWWGT